MMQRSNSSIHVTVLLAQSLPLSFLIFSIQTLDFPVFSFSIISSDKLPHRTFLVCLLLVSICGKINYTTLQLKESYTTAETLRLPLGGLHKFQFHKCLTIPFHITCVKALIYLPKYLVYFI